MEPDSREEKTALAYLSDVADMGGRQLRRNSYYTTNTLQLLEALMGRGDKAREGASSERLLDEVNTYLYVQAEEIPKISRAVRMFRKWRLTMGHEEAWDEFQCTYVHPFLATLSPEEKAAVQDQLSRAGEIEAAVVQASPPSGTGKKERHDPN